MMKNIMKKCLGGLLLAILASGFITGTCTAKAQAASVEYQTYVQLEGWKGYAKNGVTSGTTGKSRAMEAIRIRLKGVSGSITYQTHLQGIGWTSWKSNNGQSGTTGQSRPIEAIRIKLTGSAGKLYDVYYRVHVGQFGWLGWTKNGNTAGSVGCSMRMEAIQIKLCTKNTGISTSKSYITKPILTTQAHIGGMGWQKEVSENNISGTVGRSRRMEAIIIRCADFLGGSGVQYRSHIQNIGWQNWCSSGKISGTTGRSLRLEAVQIKLTGNISIVYDIYYRTHVSGIGWLGWAKNGESAGTTGGLRQMEAIQIKLVRKGTNVARGGAAYKNLLSTSTSNSNTLTAPVPAGCKFSKKTSDNGWYGYHDINRNVSTSTPVYAVTDGTVTYKQAYRVYGGVKKLTSYGNYIEFKSSNGVYTAKYCHLNRFAGVNQIISSGNTVRASGSTGVYQIATKRVSKGQVIGYIGQTGNASGVHLHFELRKNGARIDPTSVMSGLK